MIMEGCQGKPRTPTLEEKVCPNCGNIIEIFSIDTEVACDKCGFVAYNNALSCVQWCQYAKKCVGEEAYEKLMAIAASQKKRREEAKHDPESH
jgi:ribosomal protein S27AE